MATELKLEVLSYYVPRDVYIDESNHDAYIKTGFVSTFLSTRNQELANLSLDLYYTSNRFIIRINCWPSAGLITRPPLVYAPMIRTLLIDMYGLKIPEALSSTLNSNQSWAWRFLLQLLAPPGEARGEDVAWQGHFSGLRDLTVGFSFESSMTVYEGCSECGWRPNELDAMRKLLGNSQLSLKVDKVKITVTNQWHNLICECERSTEELIARMAFRDR